MRNEAITDDAISGALEFLKRMINHLVAERIGRDGRFVVDENNL